MQKFIATYLTALFCVLLSAPAWAVSSSNLPACCRRSGKHKCAMQQADGEARVTAVAAKCPCSAGAIAQAELLLDNAKKRTDLPLKLMSAPAVLAQVEAGFRLSSVRSRLKRGPPTLTSA